MRYLGALLGCAPLVRFLAALNQSVLRRPDSVGPSGLTGITDGAKFAQEPAR